MGFRQSETVSGLGTITINIPTAGRYGIDGKITLPKIPKGDTVNSSVIATINQNGSPIYVGSAGAEGFFTKILCAASDIITIVLTSSNLVDAPLNVIKTTVATSETV